MTDATRTVAPLALACMAAAILSGILHGLWEMAHPILITDSTFAAGSAAQRWGYGILSVIKSAGFCAGLFGLFLITAERGRILNIFLSLALLGGLFFAAVWLYMAATRHFTLIYVLGGMWYQMIAPVVLGIATLRRRRIAWWVGVYAIVVGILNSQIFVWLKPSLALIVQGIIWLILGYMVYIYRGRA